MYCTSSQEEAFRQSGEYCHEMMSGKQVVKWKLSGNLENAVRETSSQTVASISLENIVREGNQHYYDVREDTSLSTHYIGLGLLHLFGFTDTGLGLLHLFGFTTLVWVYYTGLGLLHWFWFTTFVWIYRH
jgi:hypothetical protein